jgi:hypothetical protein
MQEVRQPGVWCSPTTRQAVVALAIAWEDARRGKARDGDARARARGHRRARARGSAWGSGGANLGDTKRGRAQGCRGGLGPVMQKEDARGLRLRVLEGAPER